MRGPLNNDRGGVAAEFAVTLPAVLIVLGLVIGGIVLASSRLTLVTAAHEIARLDARGDTALAAERLAAHPLAPNKEVERTGGLLCVTLTSPGVGLLRAITISARGCAAIHEHQSAP